MRREHDVDVRVFDYNEDCLVGLPHLNEPPARLLIGDEVQVRQFGDRMTQQIIDGANRPLPL